MVTEVVQCKECIHGEPAPDTVSQIICALDPSTDVPQWQDDDFCSYGEKRKTED